MSSLEPVTATRSPSVTSADRASRRNCILALAGLVVAFAWPLFRLVAFALDEEAYSHVLLVPVVSLYLIWTRRSEPSAGNAFSPRSAVIPFALGAGLLAAFAIRTLVATSALQEADALAFTTAAFVAFAIGLTGLFLGPGFLRANAFAAGFLVFMVPMPTWMTEGLETFLQHGSAEAAYWMFTAATTPLVREDLVFHLPGITLQVAPECSGIRSTIALFITSLVAGYFFLRSPKYRVILAVAVVPLALLRNGFRVFTIGELCVYVSPDMIDSFIHHQGGPIFFVLSLVPFGLLLRVLIKRESRRAAASR